MIDSAPCNIDLIMLVEANRRGQHLTMTGDFVDCNSPECAEDLRNRIHDAVHARDLSSTRSDERTYYNGVLRVLRRRLREVEKELRKKEESLNESKNQRKRLTGMPNSSRMLRMAGKF
jgi:hypothetical protein